MKRLADLPLRKKLQRIVLLCGGVALLLAWLAFAVISAVKTRADTLTRLETLAQVAAFNSQAALAFSDVEEARTILNSLKADEAIASACIFDRAGNVFAHLQLQSGDGPGCEEPEVEEKLLRHIHIEQPILLDDEPIGRLGIHADISALWLELGRYVLLMVGLSVVALAAAAFLGKVLGRRATAPILDLANVARDVSLKRDYALRAPQSGEDEVGQLTTSFNDMLAQIELRDLELERHRLTLEQQVALRTRELDEARLAAESANRAKSQFLATMSHEIRTPMNGVLGMTELLLESDLNDTQQHFAETVHASGEALLNIINDILDFSKIEAGKLELEDNDFSPVRVTEEVVELLAEQAFRKSLEIICDIDESVPQMVRGDGNRLRQVLVNLVGNAIKFTDHGEVGVRLRAITGSSDVRLFFQVRDTGIGMDEATLSRLFTPFVQADSSHARRFGGSGLGLAIVRELVEMMGGHIRVVSNAGFGSCFDFEVCMQPVSVAAEQEGQHADKLAGVRVLVVDDHPANREILRRRLESMNMLCLEAGDVAQALNMLRTAAEAGEPVQCVLADQHMPVRDGIELVEQAGADPALANVIWIIVASMLQPGDLERARAAGVSHVMHKPVRAHELESVLRRVLGELHTDRKAVEPGLPPVPEGFRVLLAEDTPTNQQVAKIMLERLGCEVRVVNDGEEALSALENEGFDIVFMDCQMPEMDGFTATRLIRRQGIHTPDDKHLPIIAMTAGVMVDDRAACLAAGMDDFLAKPFRQADLVGMLRRWLEPGR